MRNITVLISFFSFIGCTSYPPIKSEEYVDIDRFMGDWYVIANIPTFIEKGAHNAIESYENNNDGTIATTFTFNADSFDGDIKVYHPKGLVKIKNQMQYGGCSLSGHLKQTIEFYMSIKITNIPLLQEFKETTYG